MGGEGYARDRAMASCSALSGAQVRSKAICARSVMPRRWPRGIEVVSKRGLLVTMRGEVLQDDQSAGQKGPNPNQQQQAGPLVKTGLPFRLWTLDVW